MEGGEGTIHTMPTGGRMLLSLVVVTAHRQRSSNNKGLSYGLLSSFSRGKFLKGIFGEKKKKKILPLGDVCLGHQVSAPCQCSSTLLL